MKLLTISLLAALLSLPLPVVILIGALTAAQPERTMLYGAGGCPHWHTHHAGVELSPGQVETAALIHRIADEEGLGAQGAVVGIATAMQESSLGTRGMTTPDAHGNIGLFQQRTHVGWHANGATETQNQAILADNVYQARVFYRGHTTLSGWQIPGLRDITGWQNMTVTQAAQAVQVSAFPEAYAVHEPMARHLVSLFEEQPAGPVVCGAGQMLNCPATGMRSEQGQTPDALLVMRCVKARWPQIQHLLGLRPGDPRDHGTGRAVDIMIPGHHSAAGIALGDEIAAWLHDNAAALGVTYIIWQEHIWNTARADEGWRHCATGSCYTGADDSAAHRDHIHVSVHGHAATPTPTGPSDVTLPLTRGTYRISATFGHTGPHWRSTHTGLDFAAPTGTPVHAITAGTVTFVGWHTAYGKLVIIRATDGTEAWYAHLHHTTVHVGQEVQAGEQIGAVGATGNATGPHLHLEIRQAGRPIDPTTWLQHHGTTP